MKQTLSPKAVRNAQATEPEQNAACDPVAFETNPPPLWRRLLSFTLKIGVSIAILAYLILSRDIRWSDFATVGPLFLLASYLCIMLQLFLTGVRWWILLRTAGIGISFWEVFSLEMQGAFFSLVIPGGSVGGDLIKAGIIAKRSPQGERFIGVFSILMDRLCGLSGLLLATLLACAACLDEIRRFSEQARIGIALMCLVCAGVLCVCAVVFFYDLLYRIRFFRFFLKIADRYSKGMFKRAARAVAMYRRRWRLILALILVSCFVFFPILGAPVWILANASLPAHQEYMPCLMVSNVSQTIAAIPISFGGVGTRDIAATKMLEALSWTKPESVTVPLLVTLLSTLALLSGAVFFIFDPARKIKR